MDHPSPCIVLWELKQWNIQWKINSFFKSKDGSVKRMTQFPCGGLLGESIPAVGSENQFKRSRYMACVCDQKHLHMMMMKCSGDTVVFSFSLSLSLFYSESHWERCRSSSLEFVSFPLLAEKRSGGLETQH